LALTRPHPHSSSQTRRMTVLNEKAVLAEKLEKMGSSLAELHLVILNLVATVGTLPSANTLNASTSRPEEKLTLLQALERDVDHLERWAEFFKSWQ